MDRMLILVLCFISFPLFGNHHVSSIFNEPEYEEIIIYKSINDTGYIERTLDYSVIAFLNPKLKIIEVELLNFSNVEIFILDNRGQIVESKFVYEKSPTVILRQPIICGTYFLVINSSDFHGEGTFIIR